MADNDQQSAWQAMYDKGKVLGSQLHPTQTASLIQQLVQSGADKGDASDDAGFLNVPPGPEADDKEAGLGAALGAKLGTAGTDPGPADQDMSQIGRAPAGQSTPTKRSMLSLPQIQMDRSQVDPSLQNQDSDVQKLRDIADKVESSPQQTNLSAIANFIDATTGSHLTQGYQAPLSPDQKAQEVAKLRAMAAGADNSVTRLQAQLALGQQKNENSYLRTLAGVQAKADKANSTELAPKDLDADTQKLNKDMNSYAQARNTMTNIAGVQAKASHLQALMDRYPDGSQFKGNELREMATGLASMIISGTANGTIAQGQIDELAPHGIPMDYAHLVEYFSGDPQNTNMQGWVKLLGNTAYSQAQTATMQLHALRNRILGGYESLYDDDRGRKRVYNIGKEWGLSRKEVDAAFNEGSTDVSKFQELPYAGGPGGFYTGTVAPEAAQNRVQMDAPERPRVAIPDEIHQAAIDYVRAHPGKEGDKTRANLDKQGIKY